MTWYKLFALVSLTIFLASSGYHLVRLIRLGNPTDFSKKSGNTAKAIRYSFTGAMSPKHKESAFLHLPTYTAGVVFHLGTFLAIALFFILFLEIEIATPLNTALAIILAISGLCGVGILIKRILSPKLRSLSAADDYFSNTIVTTFQLNTAYVLVLGEGLMAFFIVSSILFLYFPLGKLKHAIYFFAARYHLGLFYGWRGTWPPK